MQNLTSEGPSEHREGKGADSIYSTHPRSAGRQASARDSRWGKGGVSLRLLPPPLCRNELWKDPTGGCTPAPGCDSGFPHPLPLLLGLRQVGGPGVRTGLRAQLCKSRSLGLHPAVSGPGSVTVGSHWHLLRQLPLITKEELTDASASPGTAQVTDTDVSWLPVAPVSPPHPCPQAASTGVHRSSERTGLSCLSRVPGRLWEGLLLSRSGACPHMARGLSSALPAFRQCPCGRQAFVSPATPHV